VDNSSRLYCGTDSFTCVVVESWPLQVGLKVMVKKMVFPVGSRNNDDNDISGYIVSIKK
jgi:hypothetical protein